MEKAVRLETKKGCTQRKKCAHKKAAPKGNKNAKDRVYPNQYLYKLSWKREKMYKSSLLYV